MNTSPSGSINSVVRLHHAGTQQGVRLDVRERRPVDANRSRIRQPEISSREALSDTDGKERRETTLRATVLNYLMESFAMAGASLYPTADFPIEAYFAKELRQPVNAALSDCRELPSPAIAPSSHWGWLTSSWQVFDTLWAHWRSEHEIRKAVDALAELDDRTLRDMGIPHRSQIEYTVRYCRDC